MSIPHPEDEISADYKRRINRVFEFIDQNFDSDLSLSTISEIAFFSPFHFHRIFKAITGETLNEYVSRRKIEKAAADLLHTNIRIANLAHKYGFGDNASFSKAFKKYFGVSPTEFKKQNPNGHSKIQTDIARSDNLIARKDKGILTMRNTFALLLILRTG